MLTRPVHSSSLDITPPRCPLGGCAWIAKAVCDADESKQTPRTLRGSFIFSCIQPAQRGSAPRHRLRPEQVLADVAGRLRQPDRVRGTRKVSDISTASALSIATSVQVPIVTPRIASAAMSINRHVVPSSTRSKDTARRPADCLEAAFDQASPSPLGQANLRGAFKVAMIFGA